MAKTEEQVSWNLSQRISDQIDSLLQSGRRRSIDGKVLECFHFFKEIRLLINYHFNPDERKLVDGLEKEINDVSVSIKIAGTVKEEDEYESEQGTRNRNNRKNKILLLNKRVLLVESYRKEILKLLDGYGYLMERKSDASNMW